MKTAFPSITSYKGFLKLRDYSTANKALASSTISLFGPIPSLLIGMLISSNHLGVILPLLLFICLIFGIRGIVLSIISLANGTGIVTAIVALIEGILGVIIDLPGMLILGACGMMWDAGF